MRPWQMLTQAADVQAERDVRDPRGDGGDAEQEHEGQCAGERTRRQQQSEHNGQRTTHSQAPFA